MLGGERRRGRWLPLAVLTLALVVPLATTLVACWLAGWSLQPVETASMEPVYPVGSLLMVEPIDSSQVEVGMAVVFEDPARPGRLVAHRVVSRRPGEAPSFRTRGDANAADDPLPVSAAAIRGRVRWRIVGLGRAVSLLRWPVNAVVLVGLPAMVLAVTEVRSWRSRRATARPQPEPGGHGRERRPERPEENVVSEVTVEAAAPALVVGRAP